MDYICSICQAMTDPHDCIAILREEFESIKKKVVLNEFANESDLLQARITILPLVGKYKSVLANRRNAKEAAARAEILAEKALGHVETYTFEVGKMLAKKLDEDK